MESGEARIRFEPQFGQMVTSMPVSLEISSILEKTHGKIIATAPSSFLHNTSLLPFTAEARNP